MALVCDGRNLGAVRDLTVDFGGASGLGARLEAIEQQRFTAEGALLWEGMRRKTYLQLLKIKTFFFLKTRMNPFLNITCKEFCFTF